MRETKKAVGSVQTGKEKLSSGSSQLSPGKVSMGCGMPPHAAMPRTTKEIKTKKKKKKEENNPAALFSKKNYSKWK